MRSSRIRVVAGSKQTGMRQLEEAQNTHRSTRKRTQTNQHTAPNQSHTPVSRCTSPFQTWGGWVCRPVSPPAHHHHAASPRALGRNHCRGREWCHDMVSSVERAAEAAEEAAGAAGVWRWQRQQQHASAGHCQHFPTSAAFCMSHLLSNTNTHPHTPP